jgi:EAL domain-containing protein (putative c-di-GMP-specific phosphodiesterase class I)/CheY-like chemotaxis protein
MKFFFKESTLNTNILNLKTMPFTILYIEDDELTRDYISQLLKDTCTNLIIASDGESGLKIFKEHHIDLIITDLRMPKLGGLELIEKIRNINHRNNDVPTIIISAYEDIKVLRSSIKYDVQDFILKPVVFTKLIQSINKVKNKSLEKNVEKTIRKKLNRNDNLEYGEHKLIDHLDSNNSAIVIFIKINEFKYLNLSLNSKISKKLQKRFAKKLFSQIPNTCNFSKIYILEDGGFVFTKPCSNQDIKDDFYKEIRTFKDHINNAKIKIGLVDYTLSIRVSIAYGKNAYENARVGMSRLLETKQEFIIATNLLDKERDQAFKKLKQFTMLKEALSNYNIVSYFQPIVNNKSREIEKYESLVRLIDNEKNIIAPYFFLNIAKEGRYYQRITAIVLENSFRALFYTNQSISINLSALDIEKVETRKTFISLLQRYKTDAYRIVLELLEDEDINDKKVIQLFLKEIKEYGVKIAIDDFGSGLSNFSRVLEYQPHFIKIDGSLIKNIHNDAIAQSMVETIVTFSRKHNIQTIAEYVEDEEIYNTICELGVDYSQGYYFGKPAPLKS